MGGVDSPPYGGVPRDEAVMDEVKKHKKGYYDRRERESGTGSVIRE
jgi:hypothetical protein